MHLQQVMSSIPGQVKEVAKKGQCCRKATQALYRAFPQVRNMDHEVLSPLDTKHFPGLDRWPGTDKKQPSTGWLGKPACKP